MRAVTTTNEANLRLACAALGVFVAAGCGSAAPSTAGSAITGGHDANPDGVPYPHPSGGYGRTPRSGGTAGSVIANFKFQGYPSGDLSNGLRTISLADYFDPCGKRYTMIHLTVGAVWCQPCSQETDALVAANSMLSKEGIVVLQALDDGATAGEPATQSDLQYWIQDHKSDFTEMLDPGLQSLSGFFNAASVPWNTDIDPRTMEILDSTEGWPGSVASEVSLTALPSNPSYPLAVSCP
jgi:hypothetical protein